jgi:hypothetical protein
VNLDTFDFPVLSHRHVDNLKTAPVVRAFRTECSIICIHKAHEESFGNEWIVSHMPTGIRLWSFAESVEEGRAFAVALEGLVGLDRLATWKVDPQTNISNLWAADFANLNSAMFIAKGGMI